MAKLNAIDELIKYFNGPNVARNSIGLGIPSHREDAQAFFNVRTALGMEGWLTDDEARELLTRKLEWAVHKENNKE